MKSEELQAGPEFDAFIAERVMGWTEFELNEDAPDSQRLGLPPGEKKKWFVPRYSEWIRSAWEVVEKLRGMGYRFAVEDHGANGWVVTFSKNGVHLLGAAEDFEYAVCRAAYKIHE